MYNVVATLSLCYYGNAYTCSTPAYSTHHPVITAVEYETENATAFIEWIPEHRTSYSVSVEPQVNVTSLLSNAQLTVPYNTHLNVSIMATLCEQYTTTTFVEIHYGESLNSTIIPAHIL